MGVHVAILGAGPAGCSCAFHLLRGGYTVTLIEAKAFPRIKVCGEFVSPAATSCLELLLSPDELAALGARRVGMLALEVGDRVLEWAMPSPAWVLSRRGLDHALLERVRDAGATVMQPVRVARVEYEDDGVRVMLADGSAVRADLVVHADGSGRQDPAGPTPVRPGVVGLKCHLRLPPHAAIKGLRMRAGRGAYVGFVGVEDGEATAALVASDRLLRQHKADRDALLRALWPAYDSAWRSSEWLACPVAGSGYIAPGHQRSFRIGNAAGAVEPVGGEGIGMALWAGMMLAQILNTNDLPATHADFARLYRARLRWRRPACRLASMALVRPRLVSAMMPLLSAMPGLTLRPWYALTGKPMAAQPSGFF
ncbi:MAG: FAD-dependent oxidoreductase [Phycisphaeraceae bacterium]|nr:MAG: FAD-dependent oxidoreductase [Phycisphaeraceae bacterium]